MSPQDPPWRKICPRETPIPLPELSETEDKEKGGPGTYEKHRQKDSGITVKYSKASVLQNTKDTASPCEQLLQTASQETTPSTELWTGVWTATLQEALAEELLPRQKLPQ